MKKILYLIRKLIGLVIFFITIVNVVIAVTSKIGKEETIYLYICLFFLVCGFLVYPPRTKYCSCGRKYTSMRYEYVDSKACKSSIKNNVKKTLYQYEINVIYYCDHCNKEHKCSYMINGGEVIEYLDTVTYEDRRIPYDKALEDFKQRHQINKKH